MHNIPESRCTPYRVMPSKHIFRNDAFTSSTQGCLLLLTSRRLQVAAIPEYESSIPIQDISPMAMVEEIITAWSAHALAVRHRAANSELHLQRPGGGCEAVCRGKLGGAPMFSKALCVKPARGRITPAHRCLDRRSSLGRPFLTANLRTISSICKNQVTQAGSCALLLRSLNRQSRTRQAASRPEALDLRLFSCAAWPPRLFSVEFSKPSMMRRWALLLPPRSSSTSQLPLSALRWMMARVTCNRRGFGWVSDPRAGGPPKRRGLRNGAADVSRTTRIGWLAPAGFALVRLGRGSRRG